MKLKEEICVRLYEEPLDVTTLSNEIYGYRNTRVSTYLKELLDRGWVRRVEYTWRFKKGAKKDCRKHYYQTTSKFLLDVMDAELMILFHLFQEALVSKSFQEKIEKIKEMK